jgi:hypothetical protein
MSEMLDPPDSLLKPRRNLVWLSIAIILATYADINPDFTKPITFFSIDVKINNPDIFLSALKIFFFYICWMYYIAWRNCRGGYYFFHTIWEGAKNLTFKWALYQKKRDHQEWSGPNFLCIQKIRFFNKIEDVNGSVREKNYIYKPSYMRAIWYWICSILDVIFRTPLFIEYIFPYLVACWAGYLLFF